MLIEDSIRLVRRFRAACHWSNRRLAAEAGLRDTVLRNIDKPGWNPTAETLKRLEAVIPQGAESPATPTPLSPPREQGDGAEGTEPGRARADDEQPERTSAHDAEPTHEIQTEGAEIAGRRPLASTKVHLGTERVEGPHPSPAPTSPASTPQ